MIPAGTQFWLRIERVKIYWLKPPIFKESKKFFQKCAVPIYIVSNIDRADILAVLKFHGLKPSAVFTSEDARAYKPRKEFFCFCGRSGKRNHKTESCIWRSVQYI